MHVGDPTITAPASRSARYGPDSPGVGRAERAPRRRARSARHGSGHSSLIATGTPWSGPRGRAGEHLARLLGEDRRRSRSARGCGPRSAPGSRRAAPPASASPAAIALRLLAQRCGRAGSRGAPAASRGRGRARGSTCVEVGRPSARRSAGGRCESASAHHGELRPRRPRRRALEPASDEALEGVRFVAVVEARPPFGENPNLSALRRFSRRPAGATLRARVCLELFLMIGLASNAPAGSRRRSWRSPPLPARRARRLRPTSPAQGGGRPSIGKTEDTPKPSCPKTPCQAVGSVTGLPGQRAGSKRPIRARKDGAIVAWSVASRSRRHAARVLRQVLQGRATSGRCRRRASRCSSQLRTATYMLKAQSPVVELNDDLGTKPIYTLRPDPDQEGRHHRAHGPDLGSRLRRRSLE